MWDLEALSIQPYKTLAKAVSEHRLEYGFGMGHFCKCVTAVLVRLPGESSLAAVSICLSNEVTDLMMGIT